MIQLGQWYKFERGHYDFVGGSKKNPWLLCVDEMCATFDIPCSAIRIWIMAHKHKRANSWLIAPDRCGDPLYVEVDDDLMYLDGVIAEELALAFDRHGPFYISVQYE